VASVAALNLLQALSRPGDRWDALDGRHRLRTDFQGAYRATDERVAFDAALAELTSADVIREYAKYQICPQCGLRWAEGTTPRPDTRPQQDCLHPTIELHTDYIVELVPLQAFLSEVLKARWNAKDLAWSEANGETRLSGTVQDQGFAILWFPSSAGDPLQDSFRAQSAPSSGEGWVYPDVYWVDLVRKPLQEEIVARLRGGIAALVTWNEVSKLNDQEAALLSRLIRGVLARCAEPISTPAPRFSDDINKVFPNAAPSGWAVRSAQLFLEIPAGQGVATGCILTMAGTRRDRLAAHALATHLRHQVEDWQNRRAKAIRVLVALSSVRAFLTLIGVAAAMLLSTAFTLLGSAGGPAPVVQAGALVLSVVVIGGLSLYLLRAGIGLGREFPGPKEWENTHAS
jgi:hypothetical protein